MKRLTEDETFALEARAQRIAENFDSAEMAADLGISEVEAFTSTYESVLMELISAAQTGAPDPYPNDHPGGYE